MKNKEYIVNGIAHTVDLRASPTFKYGKNEIISTEESDITYNQQWYGKGYTTSNVLNEKELEDLRLGLKDCVSRVMREEGIDLDDDFELRNYHKYIKSNEEHFKIVGRTRDLYPDDFNFEVEEIIRKLSNVVGFALTDIEPTLGNQWHIIIRINRPNSTDYNPPHKDFYGPWDKDGIIFKFINLWIPICGVSEKSSLPLVPKSHLLPECKILRTFEGGVLGGNTYRVTSILEWDGKNNLIRSDVKYGEVLIFSPHLIHGFAVNSGDETRVALEFRLFKK